MIVKDVVSELGFSVAAGAEGLEREITGGYAADLLSCVMAGAREGDIWVTLQAHPNVVAVADLLNLAAVVIAEDTVPDEATLARADERGVPILRSQLTTFAIVGQLIAQGVGDGDNVRRA